MKKGEKKNNGFLILGLFAAKLKNGPIVSFLFFMNQKQQKDVLMHLKFFSTDVLQNGIQENILLLDFVGDFVGLYETTTF